MPSPIVSAAFLLAMTLMSSVHTRPAGAQTNGPCGLAVAVATDDGSRTTYSLAGLSDTARAALVLLAGGGGFLDLDDQGCTRKLKGNTLVRSRTLFHRHGFVTALVDAPSDHQKKDGLGGFRITSRHAQNIGRVITDVRDRTGLPVWPIGTSRGTISAANAASRLAGAGAPNGLVLTSPVTSGRQGARKPWVAQTVFSVRLESIRMPVLVIAHAADKCIRTPPSLAGEITEKTNGEREQAVVVTGGPGADGDQSVKACQGRTPHGFVGQEAEVADGITRFIRDGRY